VGFSFFILSLAVFTSLIELFTAVILSIHSISDVDFVVMKFFQSFLRHAVH
jgi:hypothetical protein